MCVIGAGYTGLGAALELARRGASVIVLEGGKVGCAASGRNGGQVHTGHRRDQAWLENRRIMEILHHIEGRALAVRETLPTGGFIPLAETAADIELPMERPLYSPQLKPRIADLELEEGEVEGDAAALYAQVVIDSAQLSRHIRQALQGHAQISLHELVAAYPLRQGLAELVAYLQLAVELPHTVVDEETLELIEWQAPDKMVRRASLPRIIFTRN